LGDWTTAPPLAKERDEVNKTKQVKDAVREKGSAKVYWAEWREGKGEVGTSSSEKRSERIPSRSSGISDVVGHRPKIKPAPASKDQQKT